MNDQPINPVDVEAAIRAVSQHIAKGVTICDERYRVWRDAERDYDQAYARAYLGYDGPAHAKRYGAELATLSEREARDVADAAYRYAERRARALDAELRAWQSVGASVRAMYSAAGVDR